MRDLWDEVLRLEARLLYEADHDPDAYLLTDRQHKDLWEQLQWVARQRDYPMPTDRPTPYEDKKIDFEGVKARIDLVGFIGTFTELRPSGRAHKGRCPLGTHSDSSPSFNVYPDGRWKCYGCQQYGDLFDFAKIMLGLTPQEVARGI